MPKFVSYDGVDNHGVRAEVTVHTGTGTVQELNGIGKQNEDGSYRNVEVVFHPDNPLLKRKVYGLFDTTSRELWDYLQAALQDKRNVSYRIESQRRNGVDRSMPIADLNPTEQIRRILASVDGVFSHEAKTNPAEDPTGDNPSALQQARDGVLVTAGAIPAGQAVSPAQLLSTLSEARSAGLPDVLLETLAAHALAAGATVADVVSVLRPSGSTDIAWGNGVVAGHFDSPAVARAAEAEQFALDHLIEIYTPAKSKSPVEVSDEILAQAASVALTLLNVADDVQVAMVEGLDRPARQRASYARILNLVTDAVGKRYSVPIGGNEQSQREWRDAVTEEVKERLYGLGEIANGRAPQSEAQRATAPAASTERPVWQQIDDALSGADSSPTVEPVDEAQLVQEAFAAEVVSESKPSSGGFRAPAHLPREGDVDFTAPDGDTISRLRTLCEDAGVVDDPRAISDWIERAFGVRSARKVHSPALAAFCDYYTDAGSAVVMREVRLAVAS